MGFGVVVLGAGPAGLASAYILAENGLPVLVLERDQVVGGLSRTVERGEFRFDLGGHRWFTKNEEVDRFFVEIMGDELVEVDRTSRIYFNGKYFYYPLKVGNALQGMGLVYSSKAVFDNILTRVSYKVSPRPVQSMEDAYVSQFGRTLYEAFFKTYSEKVWGRPCSEMSGDWVDQRSRGLSLITVVKDAFLKSNGKVQSLVDRFLYPQFGIGRFPERMAECIELLGGRVSVASRVAAMLHDGNRVQGLVVSKDGGNELVYGNTFVSSIPITELVRLMSPPAPPEVIAAADSLEYRNLIIVNIMLAREQVTKDTWLYVHDRDIGFGRLHEPRNWSQAMSPQGRTSLVAEYFCSLGDPVWRTSNDTLCEMAVRDLSQKLGYIDKSEVIDAFAIRCPKAYPSYTMGYEKSLQVLKDYLRPFANLQVIGRYGTFRYNNMDHSVETGMKAARNILGESHDIEAVNAEREYLEEKRFKVA